MENKRITMLVILLVSLVSEFYFSRANTPTYIVFVEKPHGLVSAQADELNNYYNSFLPQTVSSTGEKLERIVQRYKNVATGFAAKLTATEAQDLKMKQGVLSVKPQKTLSLHTTHTPSFLGLHQNTGVWDQTNYGKGVIIGLLDTGITPGHPSFNDNGMSPPPAKWKGKCEFGATACNNKLIGARNFVKGVNTPLDTEGHGTHTSSTAAGNFVEGASFFGNANGTAVGIAPLAHIAMYKVCSDVGCEDSAILAAMDAAVEDGVDILSLSLGGGTLPFYSDSIAVGAYGAMEKGVFVSCSAGNEGPTDQTLSNEAPWILTVGASTIDRNIRAVVQLGNSNELNGQSAFQVKDFPPTQLPLVFPGANGSQSASSCSAGSLGNLSLQGKAVLCVGVFGSVAKGQVVKNAGGAAMIVMNDVVAGYTTFPSAHVLPASNVDYAAGLSIQAYIKSTANPTATILFKGTVIGDSTAPAVAFFSSRGPNVASPGILKPDIIGPGVNILAAWPISVENITNTKSTFNIESGTSMSCPHLAGVAALLKSSHPSWTPAAIKSAIMTTANLNNFGGKPIFNEMGTTADVLAIGAGHVNPSGANDPGLIYDIQPADYIPYLCGLNYTAKEIEILVNQKTDCSIVKSIPEAQLNYPSFSIVLSGNRTQEYTRIVTNVGQADSSYTCEITTPPDLDISIAVTPDHLVFTQLNQQLTYTVAFTKIGGNHGKLNTQGYLTWTSSQHVVRSPIFITL